MADKKELNLEEAEKVSGGMDPNSVSPEEWEKIMHGPYSHVIGGVQNNPEIATESVSHPNPAAVNNGPGGVLNPKKPDEKDNNLNISF